MIIALNVKEEDMGSKARMLILTVLIGAVLLTFFKLLYPRIALTQTLTLVTVISIIIAFIIDKIISSRESGGE
jgi:uncharacterized membrane protein YdcZ (DUF606 family)